MYVPAHRDAAQDIALRGAPLAVYDWLIYQLEPHRFKVLKIAGAALSLRMKRHTVIRALRVLCARGYLELSRVEHGKHSYRLCMTRVTPEVPFAGPSRPAA